MTDFIVEIDDIETELVARMPNAKEKKEAEMVRASTFAEFVGAGALLKPALDEHMRAQGLWDDDRETKVDDLRKVIVEGDRVLGGGGIRKSKGREIAISMSVARNELLALLLKYNELNNNTAESQADNAKFNFLVSRCIVYKTSGSPLFSSTNDYDEKADTGYGQLAATNFAAIYHGHDPNYNDNLPENKFLSRFGFIDSDYNLVDGDGKFVDVEGNLIEDQDQEEEVQEQPFLDDDDQPIE